MSAAHFYIVFQFQQDYWSHRLTNGWRWWAPRKAIKIATEKKKIKPSPKHPLKLHVWGAISRQGPGPLLTVDAKFIYLQSKKVLNTMLGPGTIGQGALDLGHQVSQTHKPDRCKRLNLAASSPSQWLLTWNEVTVSPHQRCLIQPPLKGFSG